MKDNPFGNCDVCSMSERDVPIEIPADEDRRVSADAVVPEFFPSTFYPSGNGLRKYAPIVLPSFRTIFLPITGFVPSFSP